MKIRYRPAAVRELAEAIRWYGERDTDVANEFRAVVKAKLREAAKAPHHWPLEFDGTRHILAGSFPYALIVREFRGVLEVVAISHASREPGYWRDRLNDS